MNVTLADISKLFQDQLKTFITGDLTKTIAAEVAKVNNGGGTTDRAAARAKELEVIIKHANDELQLIKDHRWREPLVLPTPAPQIVMHNDPNRPLRPRFDPNVLPKYTHYKTNLQEWFTELQTEVNLFGEDLVCAAIPRYCFAENSVVRAWYLGLNEATQTFITKDRGCWERMKAVMSRQWLYQWGWR